MDNKTVNTPHIIGAKDVGETSLVELNTEQIHNTNSLFWDTKGSDVLGETSLPNYGAFLTDKRYKFFENLKDKNILEIGCGSGKSLQYVANRQPANLWGLDISHNQINKTKHYLAENNISATLVCSPMEVNCGIPECYFDLVFSIYAIGWTTDLDATFTQIASYLKKDGQFIFSWSHPIHKSVAYEKDTLVFKKNYYDESWYQVEIGNGTLTLADRKLSTYINALAKAGFVIEHLIEESDEELIEASIIHSDFAKKASMLPATFVIKARKL